ncbi:MAG TPA: outer membrane protein assembly factor, partial [Sphingomonas sp.]|nr:outer membrane protein assembly factor [Sphingomonas sp.]
MSSAVSRRRAGGACAAIVLIACPVAARAQDAPSAPASAAPPAGQTLDPDSPLAPLPGLGVDWPDLSAPDSSLGALPPAPGEPAILPPAPAPNAAAPKAAMPVTGEQRYTLTIEGLDGIDAPGLKERFDSLSSLRQGEGKPANAAQIDRRAREDADSL